MEANIDTPVQYLKGVGPHLGRAFQKRGITTIEDLIHWYPRGYQDRRAARKISDLKEGELVSLRAQVVGVRSQNLGRSKRKMWDVVLRDSSGVIHCKYFRTPYKGYFERFSPNMFVRVEGQVTLYRGNIEFHHPDIRDDESDDENLDAIIPLYTETEGLSPRRISKIISLAFNRLEGKIEETLPRWLLEKYKLPPREVSLRALHIPPEESGLDFSQRKSKYHRRVIFEEFFWMQLVLMSRKSTAIRLKAHQMSGNSSTIKAFIESLPFSLTHDQEKALGEIIEDLNCPHPMHRLVQGDVGSGKTAVAFLAAAYTLVNGNQCALMAPTEILCEQHYKKAKEIFEPLGFKVGFLTGRMKKSERELISNQLTSGEISLVIGTHALIQEDVDFKSLGLAIIDEQHRFGVHQRRLLKTKGLSPHFLVMTATPIPRSLAMTLYGDLDVSLIKESPRGRKPVVTRVVFESKRAQVMGFMETQIKAGRQVYIILPLVEESEKMDLKDAINEYEKLKKQYPKIRFGLIHGRMKSEEKEESMNLFRQGKLDALVSTTVIEVGVDVPNANMILIEHSERFGLSQLHQLRGRVGRGEHKSYCVLMLGNAVSEDSRNRVRVMAETNNGFEIADRDLEIRGPGDFLGTRQSGLEGFKMANMVRDFEILVEARKAAQEVIARDPNLSRPEHSKLKMELSRGDGFLALATSG